MSKKTKKDSKKESRWDDRILEQLVHEIVNSNNCIFFIGGGLSRKLGYPPWNGVLKELAKIGLESSYIPDINKKRIKKKIRDNNFTGLLEEMDDIFEHCRADYAEAIKNIVLVKSLIIWAMLNLKLKKLNLIITLKLL